VPASDPAARPFPGGPGGGPGPEYAGLEERIDAILPQTQCTRCGYSGCRPYAEAIAAGRSGIDQCAPGGEAVIAALAGLTGRPLVPLDPRHGAVGPLQRACIDEAGCIGCTLCIQACPVDAIVGAAKRMHTVLAAQCTGCELCLPACPVDCIVLEPPLPGLEEWTAERAAAARDQYQARLRRLARPRGAARADDEAPRAEPVQDLRSAAGGSLKAAVLAAVERVRARRRG